eukprot:CAMPEP_0115005422 /NCGR_PEP_ID=MMETSP0216-20121206/19854_1 /TAXON_ID=223996 /ORGANISM="Protocruzia adherens, Strain Boccale" /LENGTH=62 /DNA_ID=CAMNT_0002371729 /DNA_START=54 /DNA_END=238 /DNA_ORIENTATION=-
MNKFVLSIFLITLLSVTHAAWVEEHLILNRKQLRPAGMFNSDGYKIRGYAFSDSDTPDYYWA